MPHRTLFQQLDIVALVDDLVECRDGRLVMILESTSINLDLKSDAEADVLISHYQHFLQSLTYPIQLVAQTRAVEMEQQFLALEKRIANASTPTQRPLLQDYQAFLSQLVVGRNMLTRRFLIIVQSTVGAADLPAREELMLHKEQICRALQTLELKAHQLDTMALAQLFYLAFQPDKAQVQPLIKEAWS
jgi:hypothetical protein